MILKGYDDYEHNRKEFEKEFKKVGVPDKLRKEMNGEPEVIEEESISTGKMKQRKSLTGFWSKFKDGIIDLFKEEEDKHL